MRLFRAARIFSRYLMVLLWGAEATYLTSFAAEYRAARSVHLVYPAPEGSLFYQEMVIEKSVNGSYFMAAGWDTGYFGLQQLDAATETVVIFSVWDPTPGDDAKVVKQEDRVELLYEGEGVRISPRNPSGAISQRLGAEHGRGLDRADPSTVHGFGSGMGIAR